MTRCVGAFLVAGPFDEAQPEIEKGLPAREGDAAAAGGSWRLAFASGLRRTIALGRRGDMGFLYAQVDLPQGADETRYLLFESYADTSFWIDGLPVPERANQLSRVRIEPGTGAKTLLVRVELEGYPAGMRIFLGRAEGNDIAPRPTRLRLAEAGAERLARLFAQSLTVLRSPGMAREGERVSVALTRRRACPELEGEFAAEFAVEPPAALEPVEVRAGPIAELNAEFLAEATYIVARGAPGRYEVEASVTLDGKPFAKATASGLVVEGLGRSVSKLEADAKKLLGRKGVVESAVAYALLQAEKTRLSLARGGGAVDADRIAGDIETAERALAEAAAGRDFQAGKTGFMERTYWSRVDDSAQPYLVYVPTSYRPKESVQWPLVVYLHGYVPEYDKDAWVGEYPEMNAAMEAEGCILAVPFARGNTDFLNVGEDDVLAVIEEMKREYPVDPRRIYLYGYSMGGSGVWTLLTHYPDRFAAAVVIAGRTDYYYWHFQSVLPEDRFVGSKDVPGWEERQKEWERRLEAWKARFPAWKRFIIDCDNPIGLAENIKHIPVRVYHGTGDWVVKHRQSTAMVEKLKALGGKPELLWVEGGTHWSLFDAVLFKREPVAWMKRHRLPERRPQRSTVTAYHPRYGKAWSRRAAVFRRCLEPAELRWRGTAFGARNVSHIYRGFGSPHELTEDGVEPYKSFREREGLMKVLETVGPVKEAFRYPFAVVYGTQGAAAERAAVRANADKFVEEWRKWAKGSPPTYADTAVTPEVAKERNLVLFGEPETNSYIAKIADRLPIKWNRTEAEVAGRKYPLARRGLVFCYPNPESPERLVVCWSGHHWGKALSFNHKFDWIPDFIVYEEYPDPLDPMDGINQPVVAGFFGPDWSLKNGRVFVTKEKPRRLAPAPAW